MSDGAVKRPWRAQWDLPTGERRQFENEGELDEVVLGQSDGPGGACSCIHIEHMDRGTYFVDVAGVCFWLKADRRGRLSITGGELRDVDMHLARSGSFTVTRTKPLRRWR